MQCRCVVKHMQHGRRELASGHPALCAGGRARRVGWGADQQGRRACEHVRHGLRELAGAALWCGGIGTGVGGV